MELQEKEISRLQRLLRKQEHTKRQSLHQDQVEKDRQIEILQQEMQRKLASIESMHKDDLGKLQKECQEWAQRLEGVKDEHQKETELLTVKHQEDLLQKLDEQKTRHASEITKVRKTFA